MGSLRPMFDPDIPPLTDPSKPPYTHQMPLGFSTEILKRKRSWFQQLRLPQSLQQQRRQADDGLRMSGEPLGESANEMQDGGDETALVHHRNHRQHAEKHFHVLTETTLNA